MILVEAADNHVRANIQSPIIRVMNDLGTDFDAPVGEDFFQAGFLEAGFFTDRGRIEQDQHTAPLRDVFIDFLQLGIGDRVGRASNDQ